MRISSLTFLALLFVVGCGSDGGGRDDADCPVGSERCPCTGGGACDPGLECLSDVCVDAGGDADTDTDTDSETGSSTETGTDTGSDTDTEPPRDCEAESDDCTNCQVCALGVDCSDEIDECQSDPDCACYFDCATTGGSREECEAACGAKSGALYLDFIDCVCATCPSDCAMECSAY